MRTRNLVLLFMVLNAMVLFFNSTEARAVANGDGACSAIEAANRDCAVFNVAGNVLEFRGTVSGFVTLANASTRPATFYFYNYTGSSTNQLNMALKLSFTDNFNNESSVVNCQQYITNGSGDPTTGFGFGMVNHGICRTATNLNSLPPTVTPPLNANIFFAAEPSAADPDMPIAVQVRVSKNDVTASVINGPANIQAPVAETGATLTTTDGINCQYSIQGGQPVITGAGCPTGKIVPINQTKLCLPRDPNNPNGYTSFTNNNIAWQCETISFVSDQCDVKTTGTDPCRYIGGSCIQY